MRHSRRPLTALLAVLALACGSSVPNSSSGVAAPAEPEPSPATETARPHLGEASVEVTAPPTRGVSRFERSFLVTCTAIDHFRTAWVHVDTGQWVLVDSMGPAPVATSFAVIDARPIAPRVERVQPWACIGAPEVDVEVTREPALATVYATIAEAQAASAAPRP
jgi:hypothetical protein